jgi:UDP-3-O-[3-hydroxymyristoyl] glucosamine N-acyltransferase
MKFSRTYKLEEIAEIIGAEIIGDRNFPVTGINEIHMVENGDITFVDHPKYYNKALNSAATIILINKKVDCPQGKALLFSEDPFRDYNILTRKFRPFTPCTQNISDSAKIGEGTVIQGGAFVGNNVLIGKNCIIHANVSIYDNVIIGDNVIIHSGSILGADAFYFQKRKDGWHKMHSCGNVIINNNVEIGARCSIDKGVSGDTIIGEGTKFDNGVQVGHDTHIGKYCLIGAHCAIAGVTVIEDSVLIWANVSINKDIVIKSGATILATSAVDKTLEGNGKVYFGAPAIEARQKWKEMAYIRKLPIIVEKLGV